MVTIVVSVEEAKLMRVLIEEEVKSVDIQIRTALESGRAISSSQLKIGLDALYMRRSTCILALESIRGAIRIASNADRDFTLTGARDG